MNKITIDYLNEYLSNLAVLSTKLYGFHWNVVGPLWSNIHSLTQTYYEEILNMYDIIGERIKQYNHFPITDTKTYAEIAKIKNVESKDFTAEEIISCIIPDFEYLNTMTLQFAKIAEETNDIVLLEIMTQHATFFEKQIWILKSHLK